MFCLSNNSLLLSQSNGGIFIVYIGGFLLVLFLAVRSLYYHRMVVSYQDESIA